MLRALLASESTRQNANSEWALRVFPSLLQIKNI